jgi:hypothetical protein
MKISSIISPIKCPFFFSIAGWEWFALRHFRPSCSDIWAL